MAIREEPIIQVKHLSKQYKIGADTTYKTLSGSITDTIRSPLKALKNINKQDEIFWALKDINFEVNRGEVVGIIGRNGAGKSTLLKVLSRITHPTEGEIRLRGRVGSLLEVGTGFHPELTGRENIYFNGAILGMKKREIDEKFDDIVRFAEIDKFLDTPVKRYSSGMYVRLAFAVAAHMDPEILVVDEVLAVGDAAFQKKCLGKMGEVAEGGRTVLFVSHNMATIEKICSRVILISDGQISIDNCPDLVISQYMKMGSTCFNDGLAYIVKYELLKSSNRSDICITNIELLSIVDKPLKSIKTGDPLKIRIYYESTHNFNSPAFAVSFKSNIGQEIFRLSTMPISGYIIDKLSQKGYIDLLIESLPLTAGRYYLDVAFVREQIEGILKFEEVVVFDVEPKDVYGSGMALDRSRGIIVVPHKWEHYLNQMEQKEVK